MAVLRASENAVMILDPRSQQLYEVPLPDDLRSWPRFVNDDNT